MIREFHERGNEDIAVLLILLEEREWARQAMIEELSNVMREERDHQQDARPWTMDRTPTSSFLAPSDAISPS